MELKQDRWYVLSIHAPDGPIEPPGPGWIRAGSTEWKYVGAKGFEGMFIDMIYNNYLSTHAYSLPVCISHDMILTRTLIGHIPEPPAHWIATIWVWEQEGRPTPQASPQAWMTGILMAALEIKKKREEP